MLATLTAEWIATQVRNTELDVNKCGDSDDGSDDSKQRIDSYNSLKQRPFDFVVVQSFSLYSDYLVEPVVDFCQLIRLNATQLLSDSVYGQCTNLTDLYPGRFE